MPRALVIYITTLAILAACLLIGSAGQIARADWLLLAFFAPSIVLTGMLTQRSTPGGTYSPESVLKVMTLFAAGLPAALWTAAIATVALHVLNRVQLPKVAFNASQSVTSIFVAGVVYSALGGRSGVDFQQPLVGLLAGGLYLIMNAAFMSGLLALLKGQKWSTALRHAVPPQYGFLYMAGQVAGITGAFLLHQQNAAVWLALVAGQLILFQFSFRQYLTLLESATRRGDELEAMLNSTKSAILVTDEAGRIRHANPPFAALDGANPSIPGLLGQSAESLTQYPGIGHLMTQVFAQAKDKEANSLVLEAASGLWKWLDYHSGPVRSAGGGESGTIHTFTDITPLKEAEQELRRMHESLLITITSLIDARDPYTWGHSSRVAEYGRLLAERMDLSEADCQRIYYAGLLHDIGKVGVEDSILRKTGPLTDEEFAQMKTHPALGDELLRKAGVFTEMLPGVRHHHERIDGRGYPDRIRGEQISLDARILCVADSFDAMTSDRPYRKGMAMEEALRRVVDGSGTQFDPQVAAAFAAAFAAGEIAAARSRATAPPVDLSLSDVAAALQTGAMSASV